ncbi:hypothetical protein BU17DRAFT_100083 [Hysterangium stoloniferum]|nr:hypothetical protein BU17DRAFT_100083 [Hysterangium stoloniferum]
MVGAIPNIVALLKDLDWGVLSRALSVPGEGFRGRFRAAIAIVIPNILALLTDSDSDVLSSAVPGENSRARCNEFRAAIAVVIPDVVILLKDSGSDVRSSAVSLLENVSEQGAVLISSRHVISDIAALLKDFDWRVRSSPIFGSLSQASGIIGSALDSKPANDCKSVKDPMSHWRSLYQTSLY